MSRRPPPAVPSLDPLPAAQIGDALNIVEALLMHERDVDEVAREHGLTRNEIAYRLIAMQAGIDAVLSGLFRPPRPQPFAVPEPRH